MALIDIEGIIVTEAALMIPRAKDTAAVLSRQALDYAHLVECRSRQQGDEEVLVLEVEVQRPQIRAHNVHATERVAIIFYADDRRPDVLSLRDDFPQVPHLNLSLDEYPKNLCLYEENWQELKSRWTPVRFIERIRFWMGETARGTLHQEDQPLEPLIVGSGYQIIVPSDLFEKAEAGDPQKLHVTLAENEKSKVLLASWTKGGESYGSPFVAVVVTAEPQTHGVIRKAPANLHELHTFLSAAGCDLLTKLRAFDTLWTEEANLKARFIVIAVCPKKREDKTSVEATDVLAFLTFKKVEEVLTAIGRRAYDGGVILGGAREQEQGQAIDLEVLRTIFSLSRNSAAVLNGRDAAVDTKVLAVGLGALGSKVQLSLARAGFGKWTLVDDDVLLPHNLARHQYAGFWVGYKKVGIATASARSLFPDEQTAEAISANVLKPGMDKEKLDKALAEAELILDFSASVSVARHLALTAEPKARRLSAFLNPAGTELVILAEDAERSIKLDALEFQFYRGILSTPELASHLAGGTGRLRYSASCRDITSRVPDDQVSLLSAVATHAIRTAIDDPAAQIRAWKLDPETFTVSSASVPPRIVTELQLHGWTLVLDEGLMEKLLALRAAKLPNETGGVLLGFFDHCTKRAYVVNTIPSPPDSLEWPTLYIRGSAMLREELEQVTKATGGNIEYIGEWHSHPRGYSCRPSTDDVKVFAWLTHHMDDEGQPALMAIVGDGGPCFFLGEMLREDG